MLPWLLEHHIGGPTGVDAPEISGLFIDDFWCSNILCEQGIATNCPCTDPVQGPTEIDRYSQTDTGLSDLDIADLTKAWNVSMRAVQERVLRAGAYTWSLIAGQEYANASPQMITNSSCTTLLNEACDSKYGTVPRLFGVHPSLTQTEQDVAFFLLARGNYSWVGWGTWGMTWPFNPEPAHGTLPPLPHGVPRIALLNHDTGAPVSACRKDGETFTREYTKASVTMRCDTFQADIKFH